MKKTLGVLAALLVLSGCPKPPLPPPPKGAGGPATQALAERAEKLQAVRANAVLRAKVPEGKPGAPGGKISAVVLATTRPPRARLEALTPLGTPAATLLLADGLFLAYDPFAHRLMRGPMDSPRVIGMFGTLPIPPERLPGLLCGVVILEPGELRETDVPHPTDPAAEPEAVDISVVRDGVVVQRVRVHAQGGYPLEEWRFADGRPSLHVAFEEYGGAALGASSVAFPQKITAKTWEAATGELAATLEIRLSGIELDPPLGEDAFRLVFERPPAIEEL